MTDERMALLELIEKGADADLVRELLAFASERLMAAEVTQLTGAASGVRSPDRINHRNGYRERGWETRVGRIELKIPKLRKGSYFPAFLEPRRLSAPLTSLRGIGPPGDRASGGSGEARWPRRP